MGGGTGVFHGRITPRPCSLCSFLRALAWQGPHVANHTFPGSYDGGEHWIATAASSSEISALTAASGTTQIWAAGFTDHVTYSDDGGLTWGTERIPPLGLILTLAACRDGDSCHVWGASQSGVIVHRSLSALNSPPPAYLSFDARPLDLGNLDRALATT